MRLETPSVPQVSQSEREERDLRILHGVYSPLEDSFSDPQTM